VLPQPSLMLVQFHPCCDGRCFGPLNRRSGGWQFFIGQLHQIHKMDRISEMTFIEVFRQGC
jgi:hypothetical protein